MVEQVLYELILYGITIIQMLCVIELFLERMRITFIKVVYSAVILIGAYFILSYLNMQSIYAGVSGMVLGCILYKGKILHKSLCIFLGFGINLISELISHVFVDQVIKEIILSDKWENLILQLGSMTLTVTFVIILRNKDFLSKNKKEFGGASRREIITFNMLSFSSFGLIFLGVLSYLGYTKVVHNETLLLGIIGVTILLYLSLLSIIDYGARAEYYRRLNQVIENQLNQQLAYYERLEEVNQETRAIKHDIKNHMLVIGELLEAEEIDELKRYVVDITHSIVINKNVIQTGNSIADAVLNEKYWIACDNKINMTIDVQLTKHMKIASVDLCTILANSIDNAIEECIKIESEQDRDIKIKGRVEHGYLRIQVVNTTQEDIEIKNNTIKTSKKDKSQHGYGLANIRNSVNKYNGEFYLEYKEHYFKLEIIINTSYV